MQKQNTFKTRTTYIFSNYIDKLINKKLRDRLA